MNSYNFLIFLFLGLACNSLEGKPGMSESMRESKERGVFAYEYQSNKEIIINDTLKIRIEVAWVEKRWAYDANLSKTIITKGYQLIVHTINKVDEDYSFTWTIGTEFKRSFRTCGYSCIMSDFDSLPKPIETWKIQQGRDLYEGAPHKIIGEFTLHRKE